MAYMPFLCNLPLLRMDEKTLPEETEVKYSPSAVLNLFNNSLALPQTKKLILMKGIYISTQGLNYNGFFYDKIKDESSDAMLTLQVPALLRNHLTPNKTISIWGFISKKIAVNYGRIDLQVTMTDLLEQTHNKHSDEEIRALEIQRKKAQKGYKDLQAFIKTKIINGEEIEVEILIGNTAIIDKDINDQLQNAIASYKLTYHRINLSSEDAIVSNIKWKDTDGSDILVLARGGGEGVEVFNKPAIAEACIALDCLVVTAIGHKEDVPLTERVADKSFITPTAFGQFLKDVYDRTIEELQNSKAKLVDDITRQLKENYDKQISVLNEKLESTIVLQRQEKKMLEASAAQREKAYKEQLRAKDELIGNYKTQVENLRRPVIYSKQKASYGWVWIVLIVLIIIILMMAKK